MLQGRRLVPPLLFTIHVSVGGKIMRAQGEYCDKTLALMAKCCSLDSQLISDAIEALRGSDTGGYSSIRMPKGSGGYRLINEPCEPLKMVQAAMLPFLYRFPTDEHMFGFQPGYSPVDNARYHFWEVMGGLGRPKRKVLPRWVLTLDLKDAFPSVTVALLRGMYRDTFKKSALAEWPAIQSAEVDVVYEEFIAMMIELTSYHGCLSQGAPTSPYLFNMALVWTGVVKRIEHICSDRKVPFRFSIYADDITVSSHRAKFSGLFIQTLIALIEEGGWFKVNPIKTRLNSRLCRSHKITGIVLTLGPDGKPKLTLPRKTLRRWRGQIHRVTVALRSPSLPGLENNGVTINQVLGYVSWIRSVYEIGQLPPSVREVVMAFEEVWQEIRQERRKARHIAHLELLAFLRRIGYTMEDRGED